MYKSTALVLVIVNLFSCKSGETKVSLVDPPANRSGSSMGTMPVNANFIYEGDTTFFIEDLRKDIEALSLGSLEGGSNGMQIRVWLGHSMALKRQVVTLQKIKDEWSAQLVTFTHEEVVTTDLDYLRLSDVDRDDVDPELGWKNFLHRLNKLDVIEILKTKDVFEHEGCGGTDGMTYTFELATPQQYRVHNICYPTGNLLAFVSLLESEFRFEYMKD